MASNNTLIKLNNGVLIPALGFGTFAKEGVAGKTHAAVVEALAAGYRHLDCAWYYKNEDEVGSGLREFLDSHPDVKREDIFITTKVWPHLSNPVDVEWSFYNSLENLGTDYVDSFLIHWPLSAEKTEDHEVKIGPDGKYIINDALTENPQPIWQTLEKLYKAGKTRSIGLSNWTIAGLEAMLQYADIKPSINQVEIHPFFPNTELVEYCNSHDILPVAYSPLGSQGQVPSTGEKPTENSEIKAIATKRGMTVAQVLIAWGLKRGYAVLPKSSDPERIRSNAELLDISQEDFETINKAAEGRKCRFVNLKDVFGYNLWPEESSM